MRFTGIIALSAPFILLFLSACSSAAPAATETSAATGPAATTQAAATTPPVTTAPPATETAAQTVSVTPTATATAEAEAPAATETETAAPSEGVIRLFYYTYNLRPGTDPAALPGAHIINSAVSTDGINFREEAGARFSYDTGAQFGITDPDVVRLADGSWLMFVSLGQQLLKCTAPVSSGEFTRDASFQWEQGGVPGSGDFGGVIRTFVTRGDVIAAAEYDTAAGTLRYIGEVLSAPSPGSVASPSVIKAGDAYFMFYHYSPAPGASPTEHEIYFATSGDGLTWTPHEQNRFVCRGSVPGAVGYNGAIYLYYCGIVKMSGGDMGMAVSRDGGQTFTFDMITIEGKAFTGAVDPAPVVDAE